MQTELLLPKSDSKADKRKRNRQRESNRTAVAIQVRKTDGRCMNFRCPMVRYRDLAFIAAHHIERRRPHEPALDSPENMITLCKRCHKAAHEGGEDHHNKRLTAKQFMIYVLEFHVGTERWRWEEQYQRLKRMEPAT